MSSLVNDKFPCLLLITNMETKIIEYANHYSQQLLSFDTKNQVKLFDIFSKATAIFFESYIRPTLISEGKCAEIQITLLTQTLKKIPVVANASLIDTKIYWSIYTAEGRDKLYQELLVARETLEVQNEELLKLTRLDPLTSLLNRRAAIDDFSLIEEQLKRSFVPLSLIIIDIDWFKSINDKCGHDVGDQVLVMLSEYLQKVSRNTDILARWGGEEFLLILYNSDLDSTYTFCQRLNQGVKAIKLPNKFQLSVSIGATEILKDELNKENFFDIALKRADIGLYKAKANGRDRTEIII